MKKNYFSRKEEECPCCHSGGLVPDFREKLNKAREIAGIPFVLNSAYRCETHNQDVGGTENSAHRAGLAVDIRCNDSRSRWIIIDALKKAGFRRIGASKAGNFIHVDDDLTKPQDVFWLY